MHKKILLLSFLSLQCGQMIGMQEFQSSGPFIPNEIIKVIIGHVVDSEYQTLLDSDGCKQMELKKLATAYWHKQMMEIENKKYALMKTIESLCYIQRISKYWQNSFWDFFSIDHKNLFLKNLLRLLGTENYHKPNNCLINMAARMKVDLFPIFEHALCCTLSYYDKNKEDCECCIELVRAIIAIGNAENINRKCSLVVSYTPLHYAIARGHIDIVQLLLNCPTIDVNKSFIIHDAVCRQRIDILKLLLAHKDIQINMVDKRNETALFVVADVVWSDIEILYRILNKLKKAGIDSAIKNKKGNTVFDVVREDASPLVFKALEEVFAHQRNRASKK